MYIVHTINFKKSDPGKVAELGANNSLREMPQRDNVVKAKTMS